MDRQIRIREPREEGKDLWSLGVLGVLAAGALSGLLGIYWDIAWHIDKGRDSFFTPPHNFIYGAILIVLLMSVYGLVRDRRETPLHLRLGRLRLHPGVLIVAIGAALELFFAPVDDLWHRLFGVDATLWAPMHLIGLLGLTMASFGALATAWTERLLAARTRKRLFSGLSLFFASTLLAWNILLLAEYEFNVPAFPMFWHPLLLAALPAFSLVLVAKLKPAPWAATLTALLFSALELLFAGMLLFTSSFDLAGVTRPALTVLVFSGLTADLLTRRHLPASFTGLAVGLVTLVANYLFIRSTGMINWHGSALLVGVPAGLAGAALLGAMGAATARALRPEPSTAPEERPLRRREVAL